MTIIRKFHLKTQNGTLTDSDFVGDTPPIGAADSKYSKEDHAALEALVEEFKAQRDKVKKQ